MRKFTTKAGLESERLLNKLKELDPSTEEYAAVMKQYDMLQAAIAKKRDVFIMAGSSLIGTAMVLYFEKFDILTSKATGWIRRF